MLTRHRGYVATFWPVVDPSPNGKRLEAMYQKIKSPDKQQSNERPAANGASSSERQ
jgi:hypothetical protein